MDEKELREKREQIPWWIWVLANHVFTPEGVVRWWERPLPLNGKQTPKEIWEQEEHDGILGVLEDLFFPVYS